MGQQEYLIDTNIAIGYLDKKLLIVGYEFVGNTPVVLSVITRIELLGWQDAKLSTLINLESYTRAAFIYPLDEPTILNRRLS